MNSATEKFARFLEENKLSMDAMKRLGYPTDSIDKSDTPKTKVCNRCQTNFTNANSLCMYHWGLPEENLSNTYYNCCGAPLHSRGCTCMIGHVAKSERASFKYTRATNCLPPSVLGIQCKLVQTTNGLQAGRISLVNFRGQVLYDSYIFPEYRVVDCNTSTSGLLVKDVFGGKELIEVQEDLLKIINKHSILIGHGLGSCLNLLKLIHMHVIDLNECFDQSGSSDLNELAETYLGPKAVNLRKDNVLDAKLCIDLVLYGFFLELFCII
ncbi:exonuclease GOR-like [Aethina tumida]|uniref:exonuclease GOR-like n=1 Tax=Aethina tumida TaxID=116153 RepID=UPI00214824EC|nr:exonuclease GOR-like [Aethina tumida]